MKSAGEYINVLGRSILAGILIAIGGTVYLASENKIIGALLFSIGLFVIVSYGFNLFTGKIGYLTDMGWWYLADLCVILIGNLIGTYFVGFLIRNTRLVGVVDKAISVCDTKLSDNPVSIFILACFCGVLMYLAVDGFKSIENPLGKYLSVFLGVMVFIISGFEHCIANMFYFSVAAVWSAKSILYMVVMILGNTTGAILFHLLKQAAITSVPKKAKEEE